MLQIHRWFILVGIVFIIFIAFSVDFKLSKFDSDFNKWMITFVEKAENEGVSKNTLEQFKATVTPLSKLVQLDDKNTKIQQPSFAEIVNSHVNDSILLLSQMYFEENIKELQKKEYEYSVDASAVVSMFAVGSLFSDKIYNNKLIDILATLSVYGSNKVFFERELISLLLLVEMGQTTMLVQGNDDGTFTYMGINPTAYLLYGSDGDNDRHVNLFSNKADIYETSFYLLNQLGFVNNAPLGHKVISSSGIDLNSLQGVENARVLRDWKALGVVKENGAEIEGDDKALVTYVALDSYSGVLLFGNFNAVFKTNNNLEKSVAIAILSDSLSQYAKQMKFKETHLPQVIKSGTKIKSKVSKKDDLPPDSRYKHLADIK